MTAPLRRIVLALLSLVFLCTTAHAADAPAKQRFLYAAVPGIRDYLEFGGHGVLVFDIDHGHRFVKRVSLGGYGVDVGGKPLNVKGVCANAGTGRLYVSTLEQLICIDLLSDKVLWQKTFDRGCDRMSLTPDGKVMYLPSLEKECWYVVDAATGNEIKRLELNSKSHNTVCGLDGKRFYLAGLGSNQLAIAKTDDNTVERKVGPFSASIRPFTVNGAQTLVFANVNELLGFEIGDLKTNKVIHRVEVKGFEKGPVKRHGCPSHGIGLTPDEREVWVCDGFNSRLHVFDATVMPPKQIASIALREQPGWVTFSLDGTYAYSSTGEVIGVADRTIKAALAGENGQPAHSEKMLEIDFANGKPAANGDQFGLGHVVPSATR